MNREEALALAERGVEARKLLDAIDISTLIGLRDRALIGVLVYSFARVRVTQNRTPRRWPMSTGASQVNIWVYMPKSRSQKRVAKDAASHCGISSTGGRT